MRNATISRFKIDNNIAYLIQQISKDSTQEILAYFYSIAMFVSDDVAKHSKAGWVNKDVILYYKETPIPYRLQAFCNNMNSSGSILKFGVDISFPKNSIVEDVTNLLDRVVEVGLGLVLEEENMPPFKKPILKSPRCLKSIRLGQEKQRTEPSFKKVDEAVSTQLISN